MAETVRLPHSYCCCCAGAEAVLLSETTLSGGWKSCGPAARTVSGSWAAAQQAESPAPLSAPAQSLPHADVRTRPDHVRTTHQAAGRGGAGACPGEQGTWRRGSRADARARNEFLRVIDWQDGVRYAAVTGIEDEERCNEKVQGPQVLTRRSPTPAGSTLFYPTREHFFFNFRKDSSDIYHRYRGDTREVPPRHKSKIKLVEH